jgi:type II secretory pathway component PulF
MTVWRYKAAGLAGARSGRPTDGVIDAPTAAAARQMLRQAGLRPLRIRAAVRQGETRPSRWSEAMAGYLRRRRSAGKAEFFDASATLLRSGVTPRDALLVVAGSRSKASGPAVMARILADAVAQGVSFSQAARARPSWFDRAECAVIEAGERAGELQSALARLAQRQARANDLGSRLTGVLTYPLIVTAAGIGVGCFLAVRILPQLATVLTDAGVEVPWLTRAVMATGQILMNHAFWLVPLLVVALIAVMMLLASKAATIPPWAVRLSPGVLRRVRTAESFLALAELTESGLTLVESVRVVAPTASGPLGGALARSWMRIAERIEQGERFEDAMDDPAWFTEEHRRLVAAGAHAGELAETLRRVGERDRRSAHRLIDRAASLLEPGAIIGLTLFVGTVVFAAILPIVRLQEIIG